MKTLKYEVNGKTFPLCMNGTAVFDFYERFGTDGELLDPIEGSDKASFENLCWMLSKLAEQGELVRRYQGHDRAPMAGTDWFRTMLKPMEVPVAKLAVQQAVRLGFSREVDSGEEEEIDLGLMELEKKTAPPSLAAAMFKSLPNFLRFLSVKE